MKYWNILFLSLLFSFSFKTLNAQELNARVQVISDNIQKTNKQVFTTMETAIREFLNNRKWTNENYSVEERIRCQFVVTIKSINNDIYSGTLQIQYSRPVYNSGYSSQVFIYSDNDFQFQYLQFDRLDYADNASLSNLTSVLAFYVYTIIGLDHDTYKLNSGKEYFGKAQNVLATNSNSNYPGWKNNESRKNRFWLIDNLISPAFDNYHSCLYNYHRLGMDQMYDPNKQKNAKEIIKQSLLSLKKVNDMRRNSFVMELFFDAKSQEIINIFSGGTPMQLADLKELLINLDANNASKYEAIGRA